MTCVQCPSNSSPDASGFNCLCNAGFVFDINFGGGQVKCSQCTATREVSSDGWRCIERSVTCGNSSATANTVKVERFVNGEIFKSASNNAASECQACVDSTEPNADGTRCKYCTNKLLGKQNTCSCSSFGTTRQNGFCFDNTDVPNIPTYNIFLKGAEQEPSLYLQNNLLSAAILCKKYSNVTACTQLSNLCAMNYFKEDVVPCNLYKSDLPFSSNQQRTLANWPDNLSWLYYEDDSTDIILRKTDIQTEFSLQKDNVNNKIRMKVAVYTLNGTYLGVNSVDDGLIQLCPDSKETLNAAWVFGTSYSQTCNLDVEQLRDGGKYPTVLYDPYIEYTGSNGETFLYPVPILVTDMTDANAYSDKTLWSMVRRFFTVDNTMFRDNQGSANIVRFIKSMVLNIPVQMNGNGKIRTPYFVIEYDYVEWTGDEVNTTKVTTFNINYELVGTNDVSKFEYDFKAALGALGALAAIFAAVKTWTYARRVGNANMCIVLIKFLAFACGTLSNMFLIVLVAISVWWILFFKNQNVVTLLTITDSEEQLFQTIVVATFALKLIDVIHLFIVQVGVDIFLIDWERPKSHYQDGHSQQQGKPTESAVSAWRTYFVANEWNEIQTLRKICPYFQLIVSLLFLKVIGFENLASKDRSSNFRPLPTDYQAPHSAMFRFAISSTILVILAVLQWLFFTLLWERYIEEKVRQFVDLCSLSNVSVFIMEHAQFGYYIHGRSPHGLSDIGMKELMMHMERESEGLCAQRGLDSNTDQQTFRIALPLQLRMKYEEVFRAKNERTRLTGQDRLKADRENSMKDVEAHKSLNKTLSDFIEHSLKEIDYTIKDKIFFESLLDAEFEQVIDKGIFYNDNGHSFDQVLFYGHELTLTTFDILLFCMMDNITDLGFVFSAFMVYLVMLILRLLRDHFGRKNLAEKTLVNKVLLI